MTHFPEVRDEDFEARVLKAGKPVLVEFTNDFCGVCSMLRPSLQDVAEDYAGEFDLVEIDTEASPKTTAAYAIQGVPSHLMFADGELKERLVGIQTRGRLAETIEAQLGGGA